MRQVLHKRDLQQLTFQGYPENGVSRCAFPTVAQRRQSADLRECACIRAIEVMEIATAFTKGSYKTKKKESTWEKQANVYGNGRNVRYNSFFEFRFCFILYNRRLQSERDIDLAKSINARAICKKGDILDFKNVGTRVFFFIVVSLCIPRSHEPVTNWSMMPWHQH